MKKQQEKSDENVMSAQEIFRLYISDFQIHARECLKVRDHNTAEILPLEFRPGQQVMHDIAEQRKAEMGYLRILLLKNRRFGGSTYIGGRGYSRASLNPNQSIFIMGHEAASTETLFKMVQLFHELNPIAPPTKKSNAQEIIFDAEKRGEYGLKSEYKLANAKNVEAGRSQGIHFFHGSEEAMYPGHSEELLTSLFSSVPRPPVDTEIWRESTGKGYGNTFQIAVFDAWAEGKYPYFTALISDYAPHMPDADVEFTFAYENRDPETGSDWILIFIPWFLDPSCQKEFRTPEEKARFLARIANTNEKEDHKNYKVLELQKKFKLTDKQVFWREWATTNECHDDISLLRQENPISIPEAFRTKGSNHYPAEFCDMVEAGCVKPLVIGKIVHRDGKPMITPSPVGEFSIWERYNSKEQYFIVVDPAGGKREFHYIESKEPDKTNIDVFNLRTGDQAAQWNGHIDYDVIDEVVASIGEMYGPNHRPTACVELFNHGYTVVAGLKKKSYPMYSHKPGEYGWQTNPRTKPIMADDLLEGCKDGTITIRCRETVGEMRTFVEMNRKFGAESGCKDDRVITVQMAVQMMGVLRLRVMDSDDDESRDGSMQGDNSWMSH